MPIDYRISSLRSLDDHQTARLPLQPLPVSIFRRSPVLHVRHLRQLLPFPCPAPPPPRSRRRGSLFRARPVLLRIRLQSRRASCPRTPLQSPLRQNGSPPVALPPSAIWASSSSSPSPVRNPKPSPALHKMGDVTTSLLRAAYGPKPERPASPAPTSQPSASDASRLSGNNHRKPE